jgi:hypothetical protein
VTVNIDVRAREIDRFSEGVVGGRLGGILAQRRWRSLILGYFRRR